MPYDHMIRDVETYLSAGAWKIMIEPEEITEGVKRWRTDIVEALVKRFGIERLMLEVAERRCSDGTYGRDVNLFIDHTQVIELTAIRTGLWAPKEPWGRVEYKKAAISPIYIIDLQRYCI